MADIKKPVATGFFMSRINAKLSDCFDFSVHSALDASDFVFSENAFVDRCI